MTGLLLFALVWHFMGFGVAFGLVVIYGIVMIILDV